MTLQSKISEILETQEIRTVKQVTAQLLALFEKEMREIIGKKHSPFERFQIPLNQFRDSQRAKLAKVMEEKNED